MIQPRDPMVKLLTANSLIDAYLFLACRTVLTCSLLVSLSMIRCFLAQSNSCENLTPHTVSAISKQLRELEAQPAEGIRVCTSPPSPSTHTRALLSLARCTRLRNVRRGTASVSVFNDCSSTYIILFAGGGERGKCRRVTS